MISSDRGRIRINGTGAVILGELSTLVSALYSDGMPKQDIARAVRVGFEEVDKKRSIADITETSTDIKELLERLSK